MAARGWLLLLALVGCSAGGEGARCARNSDCQPGLACSSAGICVIAPVDDAGTDGGVTDALPDAADGAVDAAVDAPADAPSD